MHLTFHRDPAEFDGKPLILCTLGGRAKLSVVYDDHRLIEIDCVANTIVVVQGNPLHSVTPPLGKQTRTFMFGGTDATRPALLR